MPTAEAAARFLSGRVAAVFQAACWRLERVLTDHASEYPAAFDKACGEQGIRHSRTCPQHAWTNGFVERLQGTILSELWRVECRRRFFAGPAAMQTALDGYLDFYDHRRFHQGYRTQGRTPGEIFLAPGGKHEKR